jgi:hypothetical protein
MNMSALEKHCLCRSRRLRLRSVDSRWLIRLAADHLPWEPPWKDATDAAELRPRLSGLLNDAVSDRYGNPFVVWFLTSIIVPTVVRLVVDWWNERKDP